MTSATVETFRPHISKISTTSQMIYSATSGAVSGVLSDCLTYHTVQVHSPARRSSTLL